MSNLTTFRILWYYELNKYMLGSRQTDRQKDKDRAKERRERKTDRLRPYTTEWRALLTAQRLDIAALTSAASI